MKLLPLVLVVLVAGCGSSAQSRADAKARRQARQTAVAWRAEAVRQGIENPKPRFPNPPRAVLMRRVAQVAKDFGLRVVRVTVLHPRQEAPVVVLRGRDRSALASETGAILRMLDPKRRTADDRTGWPYEAFLFEAQDERGVPFVVTFDYWRGRAGGDYRGGGQWASGRNLYPFAHG